MQIYKNGILIVTNTSTGTGNGYPIQSTSTYIGQSISPAGFDYGFNGIIDDIGVWNRHLTQQEITALYQSSNTTANCLDLPSNLQQGLVGYWPFCGNALDESGNGNHGTVNGAIGTKDRFGHDNSAFQNGQETPLVTVPNLTLNSGQFSCSYWIKHSSNPINTSIADVSHDWINNGTFTTFRQLDSKLGFATAGSNGITGQTIINSIFSVDTSIWNQVVVVRNNLIMKTYLNGNIVAIDSACLNGSMSSSKSFFIGGDPNNTLLNPLAKFIGKIDDIAIWNRALSQSEITQLYNQGICKTSITVTDTLLIHTGITSYNPVAYQNTLKVWPNPGNQDITIDAGNLASMQGWKIRVNNAQGVQIYPSGSQSGLINQQQQTLDMSGWGGNGLYFLYLIDPQNNIQEVKKIVLAP